jgi:hypothetical protein
VRERDEASYATVTHMVVGHGGKVKRIPREAREAPRLNKRSRWIGFASSFSVVVSHRIARRQLCVRRVGSVGVRQVNYAGARHKFLFAS